MVHLKPGESFTSIRMKKGQLVYPHFPTKNLRTNKFEKPVETRPPVMVQRSKRRSSSPLEKIPTVQRKKEPSIMVNPSPPTINNKENMENPLPPIINNKENIMVVDDENEPSLLSRLHRFPNITKPSDKVRQSFASAANSVRKALIANLTSRDNLDVDSMIDLANAGFASLGSFSADFVDLYDAVRAFISYHCQLSKENEELEKNGCMEEMIARRDEILSRLNEEAEELSCTKASLVEARKHVDVLGTQIKEAQLLLNNLWGKRFKADSEVLALQEECDKLEKSCGAAKAEEEIVIKEMEEKKKISGEINARIDEAKAGIEKTKILLSNLC